jgi:hypothetical protein
LSSILQKAYASNSEAAPSLFFVPTPDILTHLDAVQPSHPPISNISEYPFLAYSAEDLAGFLDSHQTDSGISSGHFLLADKQTNEDHSLLYAVCGPPAEKALATVRLDAAHANVIPVAVEVATLDIRDLQDAVDEDGVYRGGHSHSPSKKGKPAPRKKLAEQNSGAS